MSIFKSCFDHLSVQIQLEDSVKKNMYSLDTRSGMMIACIDDAAPKLTLISDPWAEGGFQKDIFPSRSMSTLFFQFWLLNIIKFQIYWIYSNDKIPAILIMSILQWINPIKHFMDKYKKICQNQLDDRCIKTFQHSGFVVPLVSIYPFPNDHSLQINISIRCNFYLFFYHFYICYLNDRNEFGSHILRCLLLKHVY